MAISYIGSSNTPVDGGTTGGTQVYITPPGSMSTGDLVLLTAQYRGSNTLSVGETGGQTWTALAASDGATTTTCSRMFYCRYNGTWSADPSVTSTGTLALTAVMHVFRPTTSTNQWGIDVVQSGEVGTTTATTITPANPLVTNRIGALGITRWCSADDNTYGNLSAGSSTWRVLGNAQYRNLQGQDESMCFAWATASTANQTHSKPAVDQTALGPDACRVVVVAFYEYGELSSGTSIETNSSITSTTSTVLARQLTTGTSTETSTAVSLSPVKFISAAQAATSDSSIATSLARVISTLYPTEIDTAYELKLPLVYQTALETNTAYAMSVLKIFSPQNVYFSGSYKSLEINLAQKPTVTKLFNYSTSTETDTQQALALKRIVTYANSSETDETISMLIKKAIGVSNSLETDSSQSLSLKKSVQVSTSLETDTQLSLPLSKLISYLVSVETNSSPGVSFKKLISTPFSIESDSSVVQYLEKILASGTATETDLSIIQSLLKKLATGQASEIDLAVALSFASSGLSIGMASETDVAASLLFTKIFSIQNVYFSGSYKSLEVNTVPYRSLLLTRKIALPVSQEVDTAIVRNLTKILSTNQAGESDTSIILTLIKKISAGVASEADYAVALSIAAQDFSIKISEELDIAYNLTFGSVLIDSGYTRKKRRRNPWAKDDNYGNPINIESIEQFTVDKVDFIENFEKTKKTEVPTPMIKRKIKFNENI